MTDDNSDRERRWPDEEGTDPEAQHGIRSDVGASQGRPKEEDSRPPERTDQPTDQRGPAGSGEVPGRGKLGSDTPSEKGNEQGPR